MATTCQPKPTETVLEVSLSEARADLARLERDVEAGMLDVRTALALALTAGIEHARRLTETSRGP